MPPNGGSGPTPDSARQQSVSMMPTPSPGVSAHLPVSRGPSPLPLRGAGGPDVNSGPMVSVLVRTAYWRDAHLRKGPMRPVAVILATGDDFATFIANCSAALGGSVAIQSLLHVRKKDPSKGDPGQKPRELHSVADLLDALRLHEIAMAAHPSGEPHPPPLGLCAVVPAPADGAPAPLNMDPSMSGQFPLLWDNTGAPGTSHPGGRRPPAGAIGGTPAGAWPSKAAPARRNSTDPFAASQALLDKSGSGAQPSSSPHSAAAAAVAAAAASALAGRLRRAELLIILLGAAVIALVIVVGVRFAADASALADLRNRAPATAVATPTPSSSAPPSTTPAASPSPSTAPSAVAKVKAATTNIGAAGTFYVEPDYDPSLMAFRSDDQYLGRGLNYGAADGKIRQYYIQCNEIRWDYGTGLSEALGLGGRTDILHGGQIPDPFLPRGPDKLGWHKRVYVAYTDGTFTTQVPPDPALPDGYIGAIIRAEVGDTIKVRYHNNCTIPTTIHAHGLKYNVDMNGRQGNEGAWSQMVPNVNGPANVQPGGSTDYTWVAAVKSGPVGAGADFSSQAWWYHSHVDEPTEDRNGLIGVIIVYARGYFNEATMMAKDVDREFVMVMQEVLEHNGAQDGNMFMVNGKIFGNLMPFNMTAGDRVRWHMLSIGNQADVHTVHLHNAGMTFRGYRTDVIDLLPGSMATADMIADNIGLWLIHCHVNEHIAGGMIASYYIGPNGGRTAGGLTSKLGLPAGVTLGNTVSSIHITSGRDIR